MWARLRNYFLTGVVVCAPIGVTLYLTWGLVNFVDYQVASLVPGDDISAFYLHNVRIPGLGLLVAFVLLVLIGWLAAGVMGRYFLKVGEKLIGATPVVRSVYGAAKQIFTTILGSNSSSFRKVVIVQFPSKGTYVIGFLTNEGPSDVDSYLGKRMLTVFLPTSPNPTSGYLLFFDEKDVRMTDMTVEQGLKLVVSGGIVSKEDRSSDIDPTKTIRAPRPKKPSGKARPKGKTRRRSEPVR